MLYVKQELVDICMCVFYKLGVGVWKQPLPLENWTHFPWFENHGNLIYWKIFAYEHGMVKCMENIWKFKYPYIFYTMEIVWIFKTMENPWKLKNHIMENPRKLNANIHDFLSICM